MDWSTCTSTSARRRFYDDWLYNGVIAGAVVLVVWRGIALRENRVAWLLIGAGIASGSPATSGG